MFPEAFRRLMSPPGNQEASTLDEPGVWTGPDVVFAPTCWYGDDTGPEVFAINPQSEAACLGT